MKKLLLSASIFLVVMLVPTSAFAARIEPSPITGSGVEGTFVRVISVTLDSPIIAPPGPTPAYVTINLTSSNPARATLSVSSINWPAPEWSQVRTFTVSSIDDGINNSSTPVVISMAVDSNSGYYNGFLIASATFNLTDGSVATTTTTTTTTTAPIPVQGVSTFFGSGASGSTDLTSSPGKTVTISGSGYSPSTNVDFTLYSSPVFLGSVTTDANGKFTKKLVIPKTTALGLHSITVVGQSSSGSSTSTLSLSLAELPATGENTTGHIVMGLVLLGLGAMLVRSSKARKQLLF